jgi:hypothetical protein
MKDPIELFRAAVEGLEQEKWLDVAALCDPVSLRAFKHSFLSQFDLGPQVSWTVDELLRFSPDMPRAVAEYQIAQIQRQSDPAARLAWEFPLAGSIDELRELESAEVFARWLEGKSPRGQILAAVRDGSISESAAAAHSAELGRLPPYQSVGAVQDGKDVAYVLYSFARAESGEMSEEVKEWMDDLSPEEREFAELSLTHPSVAICRRQPDKTWRLIADRDFLHFGSISIGFSKG